MLARRLGGRVQGGGCTPCRTIIKRCVAGASHIDIGNRTRRAGGGRKRGREVGKRSESFHMVIPSLLCFRRASVSVISHSRQQFWTTVADLVNCPFLGPINWCIARGQSNIKGHVAAGLRCRGRWVGRNIIKEKSIGRRRECQQASLLRWSGKSSKLQK